MKLINILIAFLLISLVSFAKDANVPKAVKDSFAKLYPNVTNVKWEKEDKNKFEAGFKDKGKEVSVVLDYKGNLLETETEIQVNELPANVDKLVIKNFPGYKISEASKIVDSKGRLTFEAEIAKGKVRKDVLFDDKGRFLKKEGK